MAESSYPGYAFSGASPGYHYAGTPPGYTSALAGGFSSAISDFAALRQQSEMRAYEESRRYRDISLSRAMMMSAGMYTEGVPSGQAYGSAVVREKMGIGFQTAGTYLGGLGVGAGMSFAASKMGIGSPFGGMARGATRAVLGGSRVARGAAWAVGGAASFLTAGMPIMVGAEIASQVSDYNADRYAAMNDIRSMANRMSPSGFGNRSALSYESSAKDAASYITSRSRTNDFFGKEDMTKINKMGLTSGLLKGASSTEYKRNFDQLVSAAKDMVTMLNTTVEGGMSIMSQVKNSVGLTKVGDIKNYIMRSSQMGMLSGHGAQNMMMYGQAGAEQVRGTGISGLTGATMMQNSIVQARQMLTMNPQLQQSYMDLGGSAGVGQLMMRTNMNVLNSNMGKMALASIYDQKTGKIDDKKYNALVSGNMSAGQIASAGSGWSQAQLKSFDLLAPKLVNQMGAGKAQGLVMGLFEKWGGQFGSQFKNKDFRTAAAQQYAEMFTGTPMGTSLMGTANFASVDALTNYFAEGANGPTAKRQAWEAKRAQDKGFMAANVIGGGESHGPGKYLKNAWSDIRSEVNLFTGNVANLVSGSGQFDRSNPGAGISISAFDKDFMRKYSRSTAGSSAAQAANKYYKGLSSNERSTYRSIQGEITANYDAFSGIKGKDLTIGQIMQYQQDNQGKSMLTPEGDKILSDIVKFGPGFKNQKATDVITKLSSSTAAEKESRDIYNRVKKSESSANVYNITKKDEITWKFGKNASSIMDKVINGQLSDLNDSELGTAAGIAKSLGISSFENKTTNSFMSKWDAGKKVAIAGSNSLQAQRDALHNNNRYLDDITSRTTNNVQRQTGAFGLTKQSVEMVKTRMDPFIANIKEQIHSGKLTGGYLSQVSDYTSQLIASGVPKEEAKWVAGQILKNLPGEKVDSIMRTQTNSMIKARAIATDQVAEGDSKMVDALNKYSDIKDNKVALAKTGGKINGYKISDLADRERNINEQALNLVNAADIKAGEKNTLGQSSGSQGGFGKEDSEALKTIATNTSSMVNGQMTGSPMDPNTWAMK